MNHPEIKTAVILTSGLGSRFLPMTKAIPKAMFPIIDKPVIQYLVEEAVNSGIENIIIVMSPGMEIIQKHFEPHPELEKQLRAKGKEDLIPHLSPFEGVNFSYFLQEDPLGDGHAILQAHEELKDKPFAVLFGDDIIAHDTPALAQLMKLYKETGNPVIASERVPKERIHMYGVIDPSEVKDRHIGIKGLVEKPKTEDAPSDYGVIGKYICTPEVLDYLMKGKSSNAGEQRLIDAFRSMLKDGHSLSALEVEGKRFDTGSKLGLWNANQHFAQDHPDINPLHE
ncbi:MAG: UTP--glucose-1-phosphate uridylyltransferase [Oceanicoccus sp.]|jgi:UTP--glucose-1-phosphate uridylyltransferase